MSISGETMSCREIVEVMTEYIEGTLDDRDRVVFERHIAQCPPCREYLLQLRATIGLVAGLRAPLEEEIPEDTKAALLEAFRGFKRSKPRGEPDG